MLKTLLSQVKQYKAAALLTPLWTTAEVIMGVLIPYVTASLIDKGINAGSMPEVYKYGGLMLLMACFSTLFGILAARFAAYSSSGLAANLRMAMYENIQSFSFSDIDKYSTAGLVTRMTTDVSNIQNAFQMLLRTSFRAPLNMLFSLFMCFFINGRLSVVFLIAMLVLSTFLYLLIHRASKLFVQIFEKYDSLNGVIQENIDAIRVVKAYVREDHEMSKFDKAALSLYTLNVKAESLMALNHPVMNLVVYGCIISISWFGAHYIVGGTLTTGQLTSLFTYIMTVMTSLMMLSMIFVQLTQSAASGKRIADVIDEEPDMSDPESPLTEVKDGSIDFSDVYFAYTKGGDNALIDIDLHIDAGETIGVIGGTGSGKSSLIYLISRLYDVSEGSVKVGGVDVREYSMEALRNQVAVVLQKSTLFSGTILDNLRWGKEDATVEECIEACRQACADEFIERMPDKYETFIDQGGTNVSGGQRQRICIARALLKKPKVLILDDSTSAVDTATDASIRKAISSRIEGLTKVIISQRILSIQDADRIIVMDNGRVAAFDTHENLLNTCEIYRDIYEMQTSGAEADFDDKEGRR
ncbi:MAG: ABC transporter ATP-binding protein [Candidatus Cryptobacteroides sp.]|nr:ABC transporter ATP-binding protein [Candidatus Cryptobacteroides sp.]